MGNGNSHERNIGISVAMATYNGEKYIEKQIRSILSQTLQPEEIVICDDASTDDTVKIIQEFRQNVTIIKLFTNDKRLGVIENFKKAVANCKDKNYIALSDQDDVWFEDKLAMAYNKLKSIDSVKPAMVYSDLILVDDKESIINNSLQNEMEQDKYRHCFDTLLYGNFVLGCTIMFNAEMKKYFMDIPNHKTFNHDAWITLIAFTFGKVAFINERSIYYRNHDTNVTYHRHKKRTRLIRIVGHVNNLLTKNNFLEERFAILDLFCKKYKNLLSQQQIQAIISFLKLRNASYIRKKIAFEKAFKNKWIKR